MIELACGLCAAWVVLRLRGADRRWPWRIGDLTAPDAPQVPGSPARRVVRPARGARERRRRGDTVRQVERDLLATIDLMRLAVTAGHTLHSAVAAVGELGHGPVASELARVSRACERGAALVDELEVLPDRLGPGLRPFVTSLSVAASSGAPLAPALVRLSDAERRRQRRAAEERIRRLPVLALAPLVGFVLPAFVLLTIAPVAITTARSAAVLAAPDESTLPPHHAARAARRRPEHTMTPRPATRILPPPPAPSATPVRFGERAQSTVEYALILLGAAAIALMVVAWVTGSDAIGQLFDAVMGRILQQAG